MSSDNRTGFDATEILEALSRDDFHELRNYGSKWAILYRTGRGSEMGELVSGDFDNLIRVWIDRCNQRTNRETDEGVCEQTAGIAPNPPGEVAQVMA